MGGHVYRLGIALHALDHPETLLGVADNWILEPTDPGERTGPGPNVVFGNAASTEPDGGRLRLYGGAADTVVCTGTVRIQSLIDACLTTSAP